MHFKSYILYTFLLLSIACTNNSDTTESTVTDSMDTEEPQETSSLETATIEESIESIKEKFTLTENGLSTTTQKTAELEIEGGETAQITGFYNEAGELVKVIRKEAMGHCSFSDAYYLTDGKPYFVFQKSASEASVMGPYTYKENRLYIGNESVIRILSKAKTMEDNDDPEMDKVENIDVTNEVKDLTIESIQKDLDTTIEALNSRN